MVSRILQSLWIYLRNSQYLIKIRGRLYVLLIILLIIDHAKAQWSADSLMSKPLWLPDRSVAEIPAIYPTIQIKDLKTALTTQAPDTFHFDDGTTQGWYLAKEDRAEYWIGWYYYGEVPLTPVPPFLKHENSVNFARSSGGALTMMFPSTAPDLPTGVPSGGFWWLFVESPDLSENPNWQNINGFKAAIYNIDLPQDTMRVFLRMMVKGQKPDSSQTYSFQYYNWVLTEREQWREIWLGPMDLSRYTKIVGVALLLGTMSTELNGGFCIDYVRPIRQTEPILQPDTSKFWYNSVYIDTVSGEELFSGDNPQGYGNVDKYLAYTYYDSLLGGYHWRIDPGGYIDFQCYKPEGAISAWTFWYGRGTTTNGIDSTYLSYYVNDVMFVDDWWDKMRNYYHLRWYSHFYSSEILVDGLNHFKIGCSDNSLSYLALRQITILWYEPLAVRVQEDVSEYLPINFAVSQNFPNPFNSYTQIQYDVPLACNVKISIYNISGQEICVLVDDIKKAGYHTVSWDGKDKNGWEVVSGIYFYQIKVDNFVQTKKMAFIK